MPTSKRRRVFSDLLSATVGSSRNFHRLEHLGRRGEFTFYEESITGLLLAELTGKKFDVEARCPACDSDDCRDWTGQPPEILASARARALTRYEEGGDKSAGVLGAGADFVIAVRTVKVPGDDEEIQETRLLVQAKRGIPGTRLALNKGQYAQLLAAASRLDAVPYYALYVQQPDAHESSPTACDVHTTAAERSIVLVPAGAQDTTGDLRRMPLTELLERGYPLRCLAGCPTLGTHYGSPVDTSVAAFVRTSFPGYRPATERSPELPDASTVVIDADRRLVIPSERSRGDEVLLVRLGEMRTVVEPDRRLVGFDPSMTDDEVRDAARMWWRMNERRATAVGHVVAVDRSANILGVYRTEPGIESTRAARGHRIAFRLVHETDPAVVGRVTGMVAALPERWNAARNPVRYLGPLSSA